MEPRELQTAGQVIDALGGTAATARLTNRAAQHVSNWRKANRLPADTFLILREELTKRGKNAPPSVWGIREPEQAS